MGGVTNSINDSEKSVVMFGCVSAHPNALGCGAWEMPPFLDTEALLFQCPSNYL